MGETEKVCFIRIQGRIMEILGGYEGPHIEEGRDPERFSRESLVCRDSRLNEVVLQGEIEFKRYAGEGTLFPEVMFIRVNSVDRLLVVWGKVTGEVLGCDYFVDLEASPDHKRDISGRIMVIGAEGDIEHEMYVGEGAYVISGDNPIRDGEEGEWVLETNELFLFQDNKVVTIAPEPLDIVATWREQTDDLKEETMDVLMQGGLSHAFWRL